MNQATLKLVLQNLTQIIDLIHNGNIQNAYVKLIDILPKMEIMVVELEVEEQNVFMHQLMRMMKAMEDGNNTLLAEVIQHEINPFLLNYMEPETFASQFSNLESNSVVILFDCGDEKYKKAISRVCNPNIKIIYYNFNEEKKVFLENLDTELNYTNYKKMKYCVMPGYGKDLQEEWNYFVKQIEYRMQKLECNKYTAATRGHQAVINNIENMKYIENSYSVEAFIDRYPKEMPAIIVSAGPSLEKNIQELKNAKGKALIVCTDTALKNLLKEGIIPDFFLCIDPQKTVDLYNKEIASRIPYVLTFDSNHKVIDQLEEPKVIFAGTDNTYINEMYNNIGYKMEQLEQGGSVATFAFSLCNLWKFKTIILVGQDLALVNNQMYAGKNALDMNNFERELIEVEDIHGNSIYTVGDFCLYLQWFNQATERYPDVTIIDATEGGAKIKGTYIMTLKEALEKTAQKEYDLTSLINLVKPAFNEDEKKKIQDKIQGSKNNLANLINKLKKGIFIIDKCLSRNQYSENSDQIIRDIIDFYDGVEESFLIQREVDASELEAFLNVFEGEIDNKKEQYERMKTYFEILLRSTQTIYDLWKMY